ncbi:hypothetical protein [Streptomyces sp. NPDC019224]|uniref:hypothetical protein n=1 Tax=Streptomyces sp. NPDC019224 TaxID=3154484 RepID=UPI003410C2D7
MSDDAFAALYPAAADQMPVAMRMLVPRRPRLTSAPGNSGTFEEFYAPECRLARFSVTGTDEHIAVIDKAFPHTRYDFMFLVANDTIRCAPTDLSDATLAATLDAVPEFVRFVAEAEPRRAYGLDDCTLTFGFNYDRDTTDRDNGQFFEKRFHMHFNCWAARDLKGMVTSRFGDVTDPRIRRTMLDPVSFLGPSVMHEALQHRFAMPALHGARALPPDPTRDAALGLPLGLKFELPDWDYVATPDCRRLIRDLHTTADAAFRDLHVAFTGVAPPGKAWYRAPLLPQATVTARLDAVPYLSAETCTSLAVLRGALRDADDMPALRRNASLAASRLVLAGLDYHLGIYSPPYVDSAHSGTRRPVYLYIQFKLLSRIGGGPAIGGAAAVQVDRSGGPAFTDEELQARRGLLEEFTRRQVTRLARLGTIENVRLPGTQSTIRADGRDHL